MKLLKLLLTLILTSTAYAQPFRVMEMDYATPPTDGQMCAYESTTSSFKPITSVPVANGGTGLTSVAQGDLLYSSAANTLSTLAKSASSTRYLSNTGTSNNPAWAQVNLTNGVTGTLPIANGGTNLTSLGSAHSVLGVNSAGNALEYKTSGTFTPSWTSATGTGTFSGGYARYTRLGNFVFISVYTAFSQATAATTQVNMTLPFASVNDGVGQTYPLAYSGTPGSQKYSEGLILIQGNSTSCGFRRSNPFTNWDITASANNEIWANFMYQAG